MFLFYLNDIKYLDLLIQLIKASLKKTTALALCFITGLENKRQYYKQN